jgi:hypothetical protein
VLERQKQVARPDIEVVWLLLRDCVVKLDLDPSPDVLEYQPKRDAGDKERHTGRDRMRVPELSGVKLCGIGQDCPRGQCDGTRSDERCKGPKGVSLESAREVHTASR